jgi:hypothetical protein
MKGNEKIYAWPSTLLSILGFVDLIRGFLHTYEVNWAANTFAKLDLSVVRSDQLTLLGTFGISNILTGLIYLLMSKKAKHLSPYVIGIIPLSYALGYAGLKVSGIHAKAALYGKYFMLVYLAACVITFGIFIYQKYKRAL